MSAFAKTPEPPYYAVIFTSQRTDGDNGYGAMAARMGELAAQQPGFLGMEHARDAGCGITVAYFSSLESIAAWRENAEHQVAQRRGREEWYAGYQVRVCKVERAYAFTREHGDVPPRMPRAGAR